MFDKERELVEVGSHSYNLRSGGVGGWTKEEARKGREATNKILEEKYGLNWRSVVAQKANQASQLSEYGRVRRRETLSEKFSFQGRTHSEESRKKMSETAKRRLQKRENNSQFGTMWITDGESSRKIKRDGAIPEGWRKGRVQSNCLGSSVGQSAPS